MQLGDRLRSIRQSKSVSLKELERRTGVSQTYWSYLECGHRLPGVKMLEKWAGALNVPLYKLFYEEKGNPNLPNLTTDCDTWFELSTLCKQIVDSLGLVGPVLELAKNKSEAEQLMHLRTIKDSSIKGHVALTRFAHLWASIEERAYKEGVQVSPEEVERLRKEARQNPIPRLRFRWSGNKSIRIQRAP